MIALAPAPTRVQYWKPSGRRQPNYVTVSDYLGAQGELGPGPQIFSVDITNANCVVDAHFHRVDQFQVFWRGVGRLGRKPIEPIAVHFARAYTTYGPIRGGADGIAYVTVRARHEDRGFWMPESVADRPRDVRRQMMTAQAPGTDGRLFADDEAAVCAEVQTVPKGGMVDIRASADSDGLAVTLLSGEVTTNHGVILRQWAWWFVKSRQVSDPLRAGPDGARVLALHFPETEGTVNGRP